MESHLKQYDFCNRTLLSDDYLLIIDTQKQNVLSLLQSQFHSNIESNNKYGILNNLSQYKHLNFYPNLPLTTIEDILHKLDASLIDNLIDIKFLTNCFKFIVKVLKDYRHTGLSLQINWATYYKLYHIFYFKPNPVLQNSNGSATYEKCLKKISKYFLYTDKDYGFIKTEVMIFLYSEKVSDIGIGLDIAKYFLPKDGLCKDKEFQGILYDLMSKRSDLTVKVLNFFKLILSRNSLLIDKEQFICLFFGIFMNYVTNTSGTIEANNNKKRRISQKYSISLTMCWILVKLSLDKEYNNSQQIRRHLELIVGIFDMSIGDSASASHLKTIFFYLGNIFDCIQKIAFIKQKNELTSVIRYVSYHPNLETEENMDRVNELITLFIPFLTKCLFYFNDDCSEMMYLLQSVTQHFSFHQQIFATYLELWAQYDNNPAEFILKVVNYLNVFLSHLSLVNKATFSFVISIIKMCPEMISGAQLDLNVNTLLLMTNVLFFITERKELKEYSSLKQFEQLRSIVYSTSVLVAKKAIKQFELNLPMANHSHFGNFFYAATRENTKENVETIIHLLIDYSKDTIIPLQSLDIYFLVIYQISKANPFKENIMKYLQQHLWDNWLQMILIQKESNNPSESNLNIAYDYSNWPFELSEYIFKKDIGKSILKLVDYLLLEYIVCDEVIEQVIGLAALMIKRDEQFICKIGLRLLKTMFGGLLSMKMINEGNTIALPTLIELNYSKRLYEIFLKPSLEYSQRIISQFNQFEASCSDKLIEKEKIEDWFLENYESQEDEHAKLILFFQIASLFNMQIDNPYLFGYTGSDFNLYQPILQWRNDIYNTCFRLFPFLKRTLMLKSSKLLKNYLRCLLSELDNRDYRCLEAYNFLINGFNLYYSQFDQTKLGMLEVLHHQLFYFSQLRYFRCYHSELLKNRDLVQMLFHCIKLFINSNADSVSEQLSNALWHLSNSLGRCQWTKLYDLSYNKFQRKIQKIGLKNNSTRNQLKTKNIVSAYSLLVSHILYQSIDDYPKLLREYSEMVDLYNHLPSGDLNIVQIDLSLLAIRCSVSLSNRLLTTLPQVIPSLFSIDSYMSLLDRTINPHSIQLTLKQIEVKKRSELFHNEMLSFLSDYLNKISLDDKYFNQQLFQSSLLDIHSILKEVIDSYNKSDFALLEKYEQFCLQLIFNGKATTLASKKIVSLYLFSIIQIKQETFTRLKITHYPHLTLPNDKLSIDKIITRTLHSDLFISNGIPLYSVHKEFDFNFNKAFDSMNNERKCNTDEFKQLFYYCISINDFIIDRYRINQPEAVSIARSSTDDCFWYFSFFLNYIYQYSHQTELNSRDENCITYEVIASITDEALKNEAFDSVLTLSVSIQFTGALIAYDILINKSRDSLKASKIREHLRKIMQYHNNSYDKYLNKSIIFCMKFILKHCSIKDIHFYFKEDKEGSIFFHYTYGEELAERIINTLSELFIMKNSYVYNVDNPLSLVSIDEAKHKHLYLSKSLFEKILSNKQKVIEYRDMLLLHIDDLFASAKSFSYSGFVYKYNNTTTEYIQHLLSLSKQSPDNKEMIILMLRITLFYQKHLITVPCLLIDLLLNSAQLIDLEPANYQTYLDLKLNFQIKCSIDYIIEYLLLIQTKVSSLSLQTSKYLIDFIINIIKENIVDIIKGNYYKCLDVIFSILDTTNSTLLIEYITNNLCVFFINSASLSQKEKLIADLRAVLTNDTEKEIKQIVALHVLCVFTKGYYLYVPSFVQEIFIFFRMLNQKFYRNIGESSRIIKKNIKEFTAKYKYSLHYVECNINEECRDAIKDLTNTIYYFS